MRCPVRSRRSRYSSTSLPAQLLATLPSDGPDEHAVEVAIGRLRTALGDARIVQTVVKRGYRLAYEPERAGSCGVDEPIADAPPAYAVPARASS
ncbi:MAG TPA: winged helix-turn-helix domain-containing protein [Jatrophihabitantaceae bacterium]|jgi:DNA-binding winged helix-turn-helix (wHTH) protein